MFNYCVVACTIFIQNLPRVLQIVRDIKALVSILKRTKIYFKIIERKILTRKKSDLLKVRSSGRGLHFLAELNSSKLFFRLYLKLKQKPLV